MSAVAGIASLRGNRREERGRIWKKKKKQNGEKEIEQAEDAQTKQESTCKRHNAVRAKKKMATRRKDRKWEKTYVWKTRTVSLHEERAKRKERAHQRIPLQRRRCKSELRVPRKSVRRMSKSEKERIDSKTKATQAYCKEESAKTVRIRPFVPIYLSGRVCETKVMKREHNTRL